MSISNEEFSVIIIPDTQGLALVKSDMYMKMSEWIEDHVESLNLKIVLHTGDLVQHPEKEDQFQWAHNALTKIDQADIPFLLAPGCHDYDNGLEIDRASTRFNQYFGLHRYRGKSWFGGSFDSVTADSCYAKMEIGGIKYLFLSLEYSPFNEVLAWADIVLQSHRDHQVIITTHVYMYMYGERTKPGDKHHPDIINPGGRGGNDGEDMWQKSFRKHPNLLAVFSGHHIREKNVSYRVDAGDHGNEVLQSFQNWQSTPNYGEGRIRILRINPITNEINMTVLNPNTGQYEHEEGYEFSAILKR